MYTPCIRIKSSRKRIDINGFKTEASCNSKLCSYLSEHCIGIPFAAGLNLIPMYSMYVNQQQDQIDYFWYTKWNYQWLPACMAHFTFPTDWSSAVAIAAKTRRSSSWMLSLNLLIRSFGAWSGWCAFALWTASCARYKKSGLEVLCELIKFTAWSVNM